MITTLAIKSAAALVITPMAVSWRASDKRPSAAFNLARMGIVLKRIAEARSRGDQNGTNNCQRNTDIGRARWLIIAGRFHRGFPHAERSHSGAE